MILFSGCSFTWGDTLKRNNRELLHYPHILSKMLNDTYLDLSMRGQCNYRAYEKIHTYLLSAIQKEVEMPKIIVWQLTDFFRRGIFKSKASGQQKPGDLKSQLFLEDYNTYAKSVIWSNIYKMDSEKVNATEKNDLQKLEDLKTKAFGTYLSYDFDDVEDRREYIGDTTLVQQSLTQGLNINTIQTLCDLYNIKLVIVNYYPAYDQKILNDNIYKSIDKNNFLLKDHFKVGLYNHLFWKGFNRPDGFHMDCDAHLYQAHVLYNFIANNIQLEVEQEIYKAGYITIDYTLVNADNKF